MTFPSLINVALVLEEYNTAGCAAIIKSSAGVHKLAITAQGQVTYSLHISKFS